MMGTWTRRASNGKDATAQDLVDQESLLARKTTYVQKYCNEDGHARSQHDRQADGLKRH